MYFRRLVKDPATEMRLAESLMLTKVEFFLIKNTVKNSNIVKYLYNLK